MNLKDIFVMLRKAAPSLDERSSATFELLGVFITWLQGNEIAVTHSAGE